MRLSNKRHPQSSNESNKMPIWLPHDRVWSGTARKAGSAFSLFLGAGLLTFAAEQPDLYKDAQALKLIRESANDLCVTAPANSSSDSLAVNGKINANVKGLVAKVADLGAGAAAEYKNSHSEGVLQKDLAPLISQSLGCRERVFNKLVDKLLPGQSIAIPRPPKPKSETKRAAPPVTVPPAAQAAPAAPADTGAISWLEWGQFFVVTNAGPQAEINSVLLQGTSTDLLSIKDAYAISGLTGHKQKLMINVAYKGYYDVDKVDIPPQSRVWLELIFKPPLNVNDFMAQWGKFGITVIYNGFTYRRDFSEAFVRQKLEAMNAGELGPHVTPKL